MEFCCYDWSAPIIPVYWVNGGSNSNQVTGYNWSNSPIVTYSLDKWNTYGVLLLFLERSNYSSLWMNSGSNSNQVTGYDWSDVPIVTYSLNNGTHKEFFVIVAVLQLNQFIDWIGVPIVVKSLVMNGAMLQL